MKITQIFLMIATHVSAARLEKGTLKQMINARVATELESNHTLKGLALAETGSSMTKWDINIGPIHIPIPHVHNPLSPGCSKSGETCGYLWKAMSCEGHYDECWKGCCCRNKRWYCGAIGHAPEAIGLVAGVGLLAYATGVIGGATFTESMIQSVLAESQYAAAFNELGVTSVKGLMADALAMPNGYAAVLDGTITEASIFGSLESSLSGIISEGSIGSMTSSFGELFEGGQSILGSLSFAA